MPIKNNPLSLNTVILLLLAAACSPLSALSQEGSPPVFTITGRVVDSVHRKPLAYATLTLSGNDGNAVASGYSREDGTFSIKWTAEGNYVLDVTSVGFVPLAVKIRLAAGHRDLRLADLLLAVAPAGLEEITVTGRKRIIDQRPGMLIYNAENDLTNNGGTATDVLRKAPALTVDAQGNVSIRGNSNLKILINGKYSGQIARSPADALNMLPADMIKSVEIITTPSAKYDAEGAAGIINIITKKSRTKNIDGTLELVASNMEQAFNPRISLTNNRWNFSLHGHLHHLRSKQHSLLQRTQMENGQPSLHLTQTTDKDNYAPHGSQDFNATYQADSLTEISFGINTWFGRWPDNRTIATSLSTPTGTVTERYTQATRERNGYFGNDFSAGITRKLKKPGREISILLQFSPSKSRTPYQMSQEDDDHHPRYQEQNDNNTLNREWTAQADYLQPLSKNGRLTLETGAKMILRRVGNDYSVLSSGPQYDVLVRDSARSDYFRYHQHVWAAYAMLKANLKKNWYAEAGLRFEQTDIAGAFLHQGLDFTKHFSNFIPTATLSRKIDEDQTVSLSYTQRLTRPYIWDLNPNADASDPKNIVTGNPQLRPETATQAELTYGINRSTAFFANMSLFFKHTSDAIVDFTQTDASGVSVTSKQNLAANKTYGLNVSSSVTLSPRWGLNGNLNLNYLDFDSKALQILQEGWAADININTTVRLPRRYSLQAFGDFNTRQVTLQGFESSHYYYSIAAKKELRHPRMVLTLSTVNPFSKYVLQTTEVSAPAFIDNIQNRYYRRTIKLTLSWDFGNSQRFREGKKVRNDDVKDPTKG